MSTATFSIRSSDDIWGYLDLLRQGREIIPHFDGALCLVVRAPNGIDEIKRAEAILALRRIVRRQYALLKYDTPRLNRLSASDRLESAILVEPGPDRSTFVVDFSRAMNACVRVVHRRREQASMPDYRQTEFPTDPPQFTYAQAGERKDIGPFEAMRDVAVTWLHAASPKTLAMAGFFAIACFAAGLTTYGCFKSSLDHDLKLAKQNDAHQELMAKLEQTKIVRPDGKAVRLASRDAATVERALHEDSRRWADLITDSADRPYVRFVSDQLQDVRPALLDLALSGSIEINGLSVDAKAAKRVARKAARKPAVLSGWQTKVRRTRNPLVS